MEWLLTIFKFFSEYVTVFRDFFIGCAATVTSYVAWSGLKNWNRELKGKADFEVARSLIRATYKLRDEIRYSRYPILRAEFPEGYSDSSNTINSQKKSEAYQHVFTDRLKKIHAAAQELDAQTLEAETLWGSEIESKTSDLKRCIIKLGHSMIAVADYYATDGKNFKSNLGSINSITDDVWDRKGSKLSIEISDSISAIEKEVRPHLNPNKKTKKTKSN